MNHLSNTHPAFRAEVLRAAFLLGALAGCSPAEPEVATVRVTEEVLLDAPLRLGVNIGPTTYYNDEQVVANPFLHGGFAKGRQAHLIQVAGGTENTIIDGYAEPKDPDRIYMESFQGGTYYIATGTRAGESGSILEHAGGTARFTLEHSGSPLAEGDVVWLRGPLVPRALPDPAHGETGIGIGDFRLVADDGVLVDFVDVLDAEPAGMPALPGSTTEPAGMPALPGSTTGPARVPALAGSATGPARMPALPGSDAGQILRITFPSSTARLRGGIKHYIKATPSTTYRVTLRARADSPGIKLGATLMNLGIPGGQPGAQVPMFCLQGAKLTTEWQEFAFEGDTYADPRIAGKFSGFSIVATAEPGTSGAIHAFIDDVRLEDRKLDSPTGFARPVAEALREAECGVLRFYGIASLGSLVEDLTAKDATESSWTFLSLESGYRLNTTGATVDQWMALCLETGAIPWMTIGGVNTPDDWRRLISYLAAPADFDDDARRRAAHGHREPWTKKVKTIYLEIGNEWWNPIFRPLYVWPPDRYGELCRTIIQRIRKHPHFDPNTIKLIIGGWAINAHHWNGLADAACEGHDCLSVAPYLLHELDDTGTDEAKYATLFADIEAYAQGGGASTLKDLAANGKETRIAVYELNTHITGGRASARTASEICTSAAAGVAVLDQAMALMGRMKANPINYFTLLQRAFGSGDNRRLGLWGSLVREVDGTLRPRPVWHGLRLANKYLIRGDMVATRVSGSPTWDQPENGSVPELADVPYLHAYAFLAPAEAGQRQVNLLLINRHRTDVLDVAIALPFTPAPDVKRIALTSSSLRDSNEEFEDVTLEESTFPGFAQGAIVEIPPFSAVVYQFVESTR